MSYPATRKERPTKITRLATIFGRSSWQFLKLSSILRKAIMRARERFYNKPRALQSLSSESDTRNAGAPMGPACHHRENHRGSTLLSKFSPPSEMFPRELAAIPVLGVKSG